MPYKCVHCTKIYKDGSREVLQGCNGCGSKFFFYVREDKLQEILENRPEDFDLSEVEKDQIEEDVRDIAGITDEEVPVFLDFESIRVIKPGKYLIDLGKLFEKNKPRIYQLEDGKYIVDLAGKNLLDNRKKE
ncbi:MAG: Zn-ribbon containing protein [Nanoarchaeota archaeon]|nr:Zn-ribbon containing protein [Nanoarchaeota archaeon]